LPVPPAERGGGVSFRTRRKREISRIEKKKRKEDFTLFEEWEKKKRRRKKT